MIKVAFLGSFENVFLDLTGCYEIVFVLFEKGKENKNIINFCESKNIFYRSIKTKEDIKKVFYSFDNIDMVVVASFGIIFDNKMLQYPKYDVINIHPGILPEYRGRHPLPQAILNNDRYMGLTAHIMTLEIDKGKVLNIVKKEIDYQKSYKENESLLLALLNGFVRKAISNYFHNISIDISGKERYYKPITQDAFKKILSVKKLKDIHESGN